MLIGIQVHGLKNSFYVYFTTFPPTVNGDSTRCHCIIRFSGNGSVGILSRGLLSENIWLFYQIREYRDE